MAKQLGIFLSLFILAQWNHVKGNPQDDSTSDLSNDIQNFQQSLNLVIEQLWANFGTYLNEISDDLKSNVIAAIINRFESLKQRWNDDVGHVNLQLASLGTPDTGNKATAVNYVLYLDGIASRVTSWLDTRIETLKNLHFTRTWAQFSGNPLVEFAQNFSVFLAENSQYGETCFNQYKSEFETIAREFYNNSVDCVGNHTNNLKQITNVSIEYLGLLQIELNNQIRIVSSCIDDESSSEFYLENAEDCLVHARTYPGGDQSIWEHFKDFENFIRKEVHYEVNRQQFCYESALYQAGRQIRVLNTGIDQCLRNGTQVIQKKWSVSVRFGSG